METAEIKQIPKTKSVLKVGKGKNIVVELDTRFNKLQKKMWKLLLNTDITDVEEN